MSARRTVILHHWLTGMRGGEKVLEELLALLPEADIYTAVVAPDRISERIRQRRIKTSFLQWICGAKYYRQMLPLFPLAVGSMRIPKDVDFVLSSDASVIKGVQIPDGVPHLCYCHSPPRYLWEMQETYLQKTSGLGYIGRRVFRTVTPYVRNFDRRAAKRVSHFVANSSFVADRIERCYGRASDVVHPPVAVESFSPDQARKDFYLIVSELTSYKRVDLAIEAFNRLRLPLVIIGDGPEGGRLREIAGKTIKFMGRQPFAILKDHYESCAAFINPQLEDFGIAAVEAQAAGAPVIAYRGGGALDSVIEGKTGVYFDEQSTSSLVDAVGRFECMRSEFVSSVCRSNAERFSKKAFRRKMTIILRDKFGVDVSSE